MKIVINGCYGGFGLSREAINRYAEIKGIDLYHYYDEITLQVYGPDRMHESGTGHFTTKPIPNLEVDQAYSRPEHTAFVNNHYWSYYDMDRKDPALIQVVEELGEKANGQHANLRVVEIPDDVEYEIDEYDGIEHVAEKHRTWS